MKCQDDKAMKQGENVYKLQPKAPTVNGRQVLLATAKATREAIHICEYDYIKSTPIKQQPMICRQVGHDLCPKREVAKQCVLKVTKGAANS